LPNRRHLLLLATPRHDLVPHAPHSRAHAHAHAHAPTPTPTPTHTPTHTHTRAAARAGTHCAVTCAAASTDIDSPGQGKLGCRAGQGQERGRKCTQGAGAPPATWAARYLPRRCRRAPGLLRACGYSCLVRAPGAHRLCCRPGGSRLRGCLLLAPPLRRRMRRHRVLVRYANLLRGSGSGFGRREWGLWRLAFGVPKRADGGFRVLGVGFRVQTLI